MRSLASLLAVVAAPLAAQSPLPPEAGMPAGPSGTAGNGAPGTYDAVLFADVEPIAGALSIAGPLALGSYAEVTALDSGRTVLVFVAATSDTLRLSTGAAQALGVSTRAAVRVRAVTPSAADATALRRGDAASPRLDTPEAVLRPLRRQLPVQAAAAPARRLRVPAKRPATSRRGLRRGLHRTARPDRHRGRGRR